MTSFARVFEASILLAEKVASARPASDVLRAKLAMADFAAFGLFKTAGFNPEMMSSLQKGLGWGVGLGVPAVAAGHFMMNDAQHHSAEVLRDARNQALLTAAGVEGIGALGDMLKKQPPQQGPQTTLPASPQESTPEKVAAAILVDDVLEAAYNQLTDPDAKHAALVHLIVHRKEAARLLRSFLP